MYQKKNSILVHVYAFEQAAYHAVNMTFFTPTSVHIIAEDFFLPGALKGFQWIFLRHMVYIKLAWQLYAYSGYDFEGYSERVTSLSLSKSLLPKWQRFEFLSSKLNKFLVGPRVITQKPLHFKFMAHKWSRVKLV